MTFTPNWSALRDKDKAALTIVEERIFTITHESETWRLFDRGEDVHLELRYTNDAPAQEKGFITVVTMPRAAFIALARALAPQGPTVRA